MSAIGFYHLTRTTVDAALPPLLGRTLAAGERAVIRCASAERVAALDAALWLARDPDWLPHGTQADGNADLQPIWITERDEAPNGARFLFLIENVSSDRLADYTRIFDLFDGNDETAVTLARQRWRAATSAGHTLSYWQQSPKGWERRAG